MAEKDVREILENPVTWAVAGITSVISVFGSIIFDPTGSVAAIIALMFDVSMTLFTALSIAAFTVLPELSVPGWIQNAAVILAIVFGIVAILKILAGVWDRLKGRVRE